MGCSQSTVKDQVHDTTPDAAPAVATADTAVAAAESAPAATEEAAAPVEETPAAVIATEEAEATTPAVEEAVTAPVEEAATAPAEEVAVAKVEEADVVAPVEETPAAPVEEAAAVEEVVAAPVEEVVAAPTEVAAPAPEVVAEEPAAAVVEAEAAVLEEAVVEAEPETEVAPIVDETKAGGLVFVSAGVTFGDKGVAFYNFSASSVEDPALDVKISKRFNDFKSLHAELAAIMANEANVAPEHQDKFKTYPALPALPKTSLFRGRSNKKQTEDRDAQFLKILNAAAKHPIAAESQKFKAFLA